MNTRLLAALILALALLPACLEDSERQTNESTTPAVTATQASSGRTTNDSATPSPTDMLPSTPAGAPPSSPTDTAAPTEPVSTETPTPTATEAVTPTEAPSPTATDVPTAPDVQVGKSRMYGSSLDTLYVVGDVANLGDAAAQSIQVVVTLTDAGGTIVGSDSASAVLPVIPAGGKSPFISRFSDIPADTVADVRFQVQFEPYDPDDFLSRLYTTDFMFTQVQWTGERITGEVQNVGDESAELVSIVVIGYTDTGEVVGVERTFADLNQISPGGKSPFTISLFGDDYETVPATVEALASGHVVD